MIHPWIGIAGVVAAMLGMLAVLRTLRGRLQPEVLRKLAHVGLGLATVSYAWLFDELWPVAVLGALAVVLLLAIRRVPAFRAELGGVVHGVQRRSAGELYFPIAATVVYWLADGDRLLFVVPILTLAFADAVAALIGVYYGKVHYLTSDGRKSLEGSVAFFTVAFLATHIPILLFSEAGRLESVLIGLTVGVLVMLLEAVSWRGLDNIFIPLGGYLLVSTSLDLGAARLGLMLAVTLLLLALMLVLRHRVTLNDTAVLAGVLIGYVAWAAGGWIWLVPPLVVFLFYTVLWPRQEQVRERPHDLVAMLTVTSSGLIWLLLAAGLGRPELFLPYTVAFAAQLSFIGISWHRMLRPTWSRPAMVAASGVPAWLALFVPYLAIVGVGEAPVMHAILALLCLIVGGAAFVLVVRHIPGHPAAEFPWGRQALVGLGTSMLALIA